MKLKAYSLFGILALLLFSNSNFGQYNDFGVWAGIEVNRDLKKGFDISINPQIRMAENALEAETYQVDFNLKYKINDWAKLAGAYRLAERRQLEDSYLPRHRFNIDLSLSKSINELDFQYRFRFQMGDSNIMSDEGGNVYGRGYRHKISVERKVIKKTKASVAFEIFTSDNDTQYPIITDWRGKVGISRKLSKRKSVSISYLVQRELTSYNPRTDYVIQIGYDLELKKKKKSEDKGK